jgi:choline dehydrogenase
LDVACPQSIHHQSSWFALSSVSRPTPYINFNFFDAENGDWDTNLDAMVEGMHSAREIFAEYASSTNTQVTELVPGERCRSAEELREWVRYNSWGHHACCTCPIGHESDRMAVLDGDFRVRGASDLRVVDASILPRIPGCYIQSSIYAISEKAADVIVASKGG